MTICQFQKNILFSFLFSAVFCFISAEAFAYNKCTQVLNSPQGAKTAWRSVFTHKHRGKVFPTNAAREREMYNAAKATKRGILNGETGESYFWPAANENVTQLSSTGGYQTNTFTRFRVDGGKSIVRGTLLLGASGHVGLEEAHNYALNDTYDISEGDIDSNGVKRPRKSIVKDAASLGFVTFHEVEIHLAANKVTVIFYERGTSWSSYPEARTIEFERGQ